METVAIIAALLGLVEKLIPKLTELAAGGVITKAKQDEIRARYDKLANNMDEAFGGEHWKVRPDPEPETPETVVKNKSAKSAKSTDDAKDCSD